MNKYLFGAVRVINGTLKTAYLRIFHGRSAVIGLPAYISPYTEITVERGAKLSIGRNLRMRSGSKLRVRKGAALSIGSGFNMSGGNRITVRDGVTIGNNVTFAPGVSVYDHDHDYTAEGGVNAGKYKTGRISIGSNVWIGADCVILSGTEIGDGCVVAAGTVLKGKYTGGLLIYQKRTTETKAIEYGADKPCETGAESNND